MAQVLLDTSQLNVFVMALQKICEQVNKGKAGEMTVDGFDITWTENGAKLETN